jgi:predicted small metal-binding protein
MTLVVHCRDVGFDCDGVVKAENEEQLMKQVAEHAKDVHNVNEVTPELVQKVRQAVREE